jgi:hypothetical protein
MNDVFALDIAEFLQFGAQSRGPMCRTRESTGQKTDPVGFDRLLRLGLKAKRKEQGAKRKSKKPLIHCFLLTPFTSPLTPIE